MVADMQETQRVPAGAPPAAQPTTPQRSQPSTQALPSPPSWPTPAASDQPVPSAPEAPRPRLVVAAAVVDRLERPTTLLCAARAYPAELAGRFELPGGKVEPGESPLQALTRELAEEIGLAVRIGAELEPPAGLAIPAPRHSSAGSPAGRPASATAGGQDPAPSPPRSPRTPGSPEDDAPAWPAMNGYRIRVWLAEPADSADRGAAGADHQQLQWVDLERLGELDWLEADIPIVEAIRAL